MSEQNILMIMCDQLRADCLHCYGNNMIKTPNIDRLAEDGILFSNAFTPLPSCCPARQAMLTGRRPEALGALWNYDISLKVMHIEPDIPTWTNNLKRAGYDLGYIGKWHVSPDNSPLDFGFDEYISENDYECYSNNLGVNALMPANATNVQDLSKFLGENDPLPLEHTRTHYFASKANDMIQKFSTSGQPWHIRLDFPEPHLPCRPAGRFAEMYRSQDIPEWGSFRESFKNKPYIQKQQLYNWEIDDFKWEDWAPVVSRYYGIISQMDDAIGMVLNKLDELGATEDTIVIFTSDHGDMCGSHRMIDKHYVMYDDITRVPMIIKWPASKKSGRVDNNFVYNCLDIPATINDMNGWGLNDLHGKSLLGILRGEEYYPGGAGDKFRSQVVSTFNGQQFGLYTSRMIRTERWKYIWNTTDIDELYDLENDPYELNNIIKEKEYAGITEQLRRRLYEELSEFGDGLVRSYWLKDQLLSNRKMA